MARVQRVAGVRNDGVEPILDWWSPRQRHRQPLSQGDVRQKLPQGVSPPIDHNPNQPDDQVGRRRQQTQLALGVAQASIPDKVELAVAAESLRSQIVP